jgi:hypothetical protein
MLDDGVESPIRSFLSKNQTLKTRGAMYIEADTLDDLLRDVFKRLLKSTNRPSPSKGANRKLVGALLKLRNPRARFCRAQQRSLLFSCLGDESLFGVSSG